MNTVFVVITQNDGSEVTVNPANIVSIEPVLNEAEHCYVRVGALIAIKVPDTETWVNESKAYYAMESPKSLQHRIDVIQKQAQKEYFDALNQVTQRAVDAAVKDEDPEEPPSN